MNTERENELREHLGREPTEMERLTWAQRKRHAGKARNRTSRRPPPNTLEQNLREKARALHEQEWRDRQAVVAHLERDRENLLVPADVTDGLPLTEEEVRAAYDSVIEAVEAGDLP